MSGPDGCDSKGRVPYRVLLADDHPLTRRGLAGLLEQEPDIRVCGEAAGRQGILKAIDELRPDLVVLGLSFQWGSGLELLKKIRPRHPRLSVLILSMHDERLFAERALRAGAQGYVTKLQPPNEVIHAVRTVLSGGIYLSPGLAVQMVRQFVAGGPVVSTSPLGALTDRELEVFELLGRGRTTRQIADELHLSIKTIETYRAHIIAKLHLAGSTELLRQAIQWVHTGGQS
ncbi:MAG TPA: response regulator transcription factor [Planctomycetota bacterium]|nr:response regulator transcription factor [Planctomycetota bacterium]HRR82237.1 response regulator transcription factor [Planctomycetota bacterium]HRT97369.1 response regulator transcription factor [Planctomycetota bacterium]